MFRTFFAAFRRSVTPLIFFFFFPSQRAFPTRAFFLFFSIAAVWWIALGNYRRRAFFFRPSPFLHSFKVSPFFRVFLTRCLPRSTPSCRPNLDDLRFLAFLTLFPPLGPFSSLSLAAAPRRVTRESPCAPFFHFGRHIPPFSLFSHSPPRTMCLSGRTEPPAVSPLHASPQFTVVPRVCFNPPGSLCPWFLCVTKHVLVFFCFFFPLPLDPLDFPLCSLPHLDCIGL